MKWKKVEYPFSQNNNDVEWMNKAYENFKKFIKNADITKMDDFNFGYDISKVFRGEEPRYNPRLLDYCFTPDHTRNLFYSPGREIYAVGFPYHEYNTMRLVELENLQKFCDKYNVCCTILPEEHSFYRNPNTIMVVFAHENEIRKLIKSYDLVGNNKRVYFISPHGNFYNFVTKKFIKDNNPLGDLARDMKDDETMPKNIDNDKAVLDHISWQSHGDLDVEKAVKKALKLYSDYKGIGKIS